MADAAVQPSKTKPIVQALTRQSIHVERQAGFWAILVFVVSSIGLGYSGLLPFSTLAGLWPGVNLAVLILIAALFFLLYTYTFAAMGTLVPQFGADYVVASRVISPPLAFVSSWILVLFLGLWGGGVIAWIGQSLIPMFSQALSLVTSDKSLLSLGVWAASPSGMVMLGTIGVVLIFLMLIFPPRVTHWILLVGAVFTVAAWALLGLLFASATPGAFQSGWDHFLGDGKYLEHVLVARSLGLKVEFSPATLVSAGLLASLWLFFGSCTPTCFAREVKEPKRNLLSGIWAGLAVSAVVLVVVTFLLQRIIPLEWLSAESFLSRAAGFSGQAVPWLPFYGIILRPNAILVYLLGFTWIMALLNLAHTLLYAGSRMMLTWGEDNLIPQQAMFIHPELRSPLITVLLVCLLAEAGVIWATLGPAYFYRVNPVFYVTVAQVLPLLGVTLLPFRKRGWFEQAQGGFGSKIGPLPLISITGGVSLVYLIALIAWLFSRLGTSLLNWETLLGFAIAFASGLAWFYGWRYTLAGQGKAIDGIFKRIPEE